MIRKRMLHSFSFVGFALLATLLVFQKVSAAPAFRTALTDVNRDRTVNVLDARMVMSHLGVKNPVNTTALSDVNQDGVVDKKDLLLVSLAGKNGKTVSTCEAADFNGDRVVDALDSDFLQKYFGTEDTSASMPADLDADGYIILTDFSILSSVYGCTY